ncbi:YrzK family protein [Bacillus sp. WMMC1349]|uniref:YrzK family protein n=1 Tax=Bacillus sp. WMMC1349 TaxID=2736254 RepID=UPI00155805E9|nr:YrzK family protein [Bacillus sp. WMMC1349]NPC93500.1 YrzK family protein [Bacillus sp. WMMC1349]
MRYNHQMGKAIHEQEGNLQMKDHNDPESAGFLEETAPELGMTLKEVMKNKKKR